MQKINREALKEALEFRREAQERAKKGTNGPMHDINLYAAAAILFEITDPKFVPYKEMYDDVDMTGYASDVFRAMIKEMVE